MGKSRGYVPAKQRKLVRCIDCWREYTKFMSIRLHDDEHKCIRCYNGGNNGQENDIRIVLSRRYVKWMHDVEFKCRTRI